MNSHTQNPSSGLSPFNFNKHFLRVQADDNGNPWFCAKDVCDILGYGNSREAVSKHCKPKGVMNRDTLTDGGTQKLVYISEGNLYRLIIKSNKPEAEPFEAWLCDEVLPTIRKTGQYAHPHPNPLPTGEGASGAHPNPTGAGSTAEPPLGAFIGREPWFDEDGAAIYHGELEDWPIDYKRPRNRLIVTFAGDVITGVEIVANDQYVLTLEQFRELEAKAGNVTIPRAALASFQDAMQNFGAV